MSDVLFDDPAGRTRFAWARTIMVTFVVSLLVERLFFSGTPWSVAIVGLPVATLGAVTLMRSRPLRRDPQGLSTKIIWIALICVLTIAVAALTGVLLG